jgi:hypothetical protein
MNSIFHAFNMKYTAIGEVAPNLKNLGFTHVQFPPIQECRVLSEADGDLLRAQLRHISQNLEQFSLQFAEAKKKEGLYGHSFDYLLKQRLYYINQPTLRFMLESLASGVSLESIYEITYIALTSNSSHASVAFNAMLEIQNQGIRSQWHPLKLGLELMLDGVILDTPFVDISKTKHMHDILEKEFIYYKKKQLEPPPSLLAAKKQATIHLLQLKGQYNKYEKSQTLKNLLPITAKLRSDLLLAKDFLHGTKKFNLLRFFQHVLALEFMLYPPWWLIYQPLKLYIGNTLLGSKQEILYALRACKNAGLKIITDVVVNNLAAVAGEGSAWTSFANPDFPALFNSLSKPPQVKKLQSLLLEALGTDDLNCINPPFSCAEHQEPTQCWMSQALPQFNQNHPAVKATQSKFLAELAEVGVDGLRIDAAVHLPPQDCDRILKPFSGLSYIEYVGGSESWRKYPSNMYDHIRMEDFAIGEGLYMSVFGPHSELHRAVNYGGSLVRHHNLDSVVMVINHDQVMGSIPSRIFSDLPSQFSYELSVAYLLQRIYGNVLIMPHDISLEFVRSALKLRHRMKTEGVVREYVELSQDKLELYSYKFNKEEQCLFVAVFNMRAQAIETKYGPVDSHMFNWFTLPAPVSSVMKKNYNRRSIRWMSNLYNAKKQSYTRKHKK